MADDGSIIKVCFFRSLYVSLHVMCLWFVSLLCCFCENFVVGCVTGDILVLHVYIYICISIHMYIYTYVYVYMNICIYVCMYIYISRYTCIHIQIKVSMYI